jgi:type II secretory pathway predicted ATPase ExeA
MEAYKHFNLTASPFEAKPDTDFYAPLPTFSETLATLQYAVHAGKTCSVVIGDSGSGKSLVGRLLALQVNRKTRVLWVHGLGQTESTEATIYPPGTLGGGATRAGNRPTVAGIRQWLRTPSPKPGATVVIVDDADGLSRDGWDDIMTLATREFRAPRPVSLVLFGLPRLAERLCKSRLVRLRRRIFRTCQLLPLQRKDTEAYIQHRLAAAGCADALFTDAAFDLVHRYSNGNPALINQICDNALIDAFGDDRNQIDAKHILPTVWAIHGPERKRKTPSIKRLTRSGRKTADLPDELTMPRRLRKLLDEANTAPTSPPPGQAKAVSPGTAASSRSVPAQSSAAVEGLADDTSASPTATAGAPGVAEQLGFAATMVTAQGAALENRLEDSVLQRLHLVEERIHDALTRVREARLQRDQAESVADSPASIDEPGSTPAGRS